MSGPSNEPSVATKVRVAIVEDHPAIADGLAALIKGSPDVTVVGTARDIRSATTLIEQASPDIVLCDIRLAEAGDGFELVGQHGSGPAFIILSAYWYPSYHVRAIELGARGYLSKMATIEEIISAIKNVATGGTAFPSAARRAASDALRVPTPRELEILALVAEGLSNAEIAERLSLRVKTVESQLRRLFDRYDVTSRTALVRLAARQGWNEEDR
jgi:two-component system NarL family response regulator